MMNIFKLITRTLGIDTFQLGLESGREQIIKEFEDLIKKLKVKKK